MSAPLRVGSRGSPLARRQTELVVRALRRTSPTARVELVTMVTRGDQDRRRGISPDFTGALERALRAGKIDLAIHSTKDLSAEDPAGLAIVAYPRRADPRDCLVGGGARGPRRGARVGTSSLRRRAQLLRWRPDLRLSEIRGNVDTRLRMVAEGVLDAVALAKAGIDRLGRASEVTYILPAERFLPAPGQGAIAVQARRNDLRARRLTRPIDHAPTRACVEAERAVAEELGASCNVPLGAYATLRGRQLRLVAEVLSPDGTRTIRVARLGSATRPRVLGRTVARLLSAAGAQTLIRRGR